MMQDICPKEKCTGCTACLNVCPHHAITMSPDACGFLHPVISQDTCVDCGLCVKTCPVNNAAVLSTPQKCYAATVVNEQELLSCASGGVATAISRYFICHGGVVYGCSGKNPRSVQHVRVDNIEDLEQLKGSKYVQSYLGEIFQDVKKDLCTERLVLFVGTPCQVAGLKGFLHKNYPNLLTIDLACHGVPSQKMLNDNLKRYCSEDEDVSVAFRRKHLGGKRYRIEYGWEIKSRHSTTNRFKPYNKDYYMFGFLKCLTLRENCYSCPYAQNSRVGDLTLCDFWGLRPDADFDFGKGVSAVLVNTGRGDELFEKLKDALVWKQRELIEATRWNGRLNAPGSMPKSYHYFTRMYRNNTFRKSMILAYYGIFLNYICTKYKNHIKTYLLKYIGK